MDTEEKILKDVRKFKEIVYEELDKESLSKMIQKIKERINKNNEN